MNLEAVIVCVDYADFLRETLPHNLQHFDRVVVVTRPGDGETLGVCRRLGVDCRATDVMYAHGETFNKGRAVDYGLGYLSRRDWVVHLDADLYLPPTTRERIVEAMPDEQCIYGIDRVNCVGYQRWRAFIGDSMGRHQWHEHCILAPPPFPLASRIVLREHGGYVPIGFFQLWHGRHGRRYPLNQGDAEHTDVLHALQWPTRNRRLLGGVIGVHLESEDSAMGVNWRGRQTSRFGPAGQMRAVDQTQVSGGYGATATFARGA
jgi:hypothetical protein